MRRGDNSLQRAGEALDGFADGEAVAFFKFFGGQGDAALEEVLGGFTEDFVAPAMEQVMVGWQGAEDESVELFAVGH